MEVRRMQQEGAPASSTPRERSPKRLERAKLAAISVVESRQVGQKDPEGAQHHPKETAKEAVCPSLPDAGRGEKPDPTGASVYGGICCVAWGKGQGRRDTPGEQAQTAQEKSCP